MQSRMYAFLTPQKSLEQNINRFKEAFIKYYGDEKREYIETIFSNAVFVGYQTTESLERLLHTIEEEITQELITEIIKKHNSNLTINNITSNYSFKHSISHPIFQYMKLLNAYNLQQSGRREKFIQEGFEYMQRFSNKINYSDYLRMCETKELPEEFNNLPSPVLNMMQLYLNLDVPEQQYLRLFNAAEEFIHNIDPTVTQDNFETFIETHQDINELSKSYEEASEEYSRRRVELEEYYKVVANSKELKKEIEQEYFKLWISDNPDILDEKQKEDAMAFVQGEKDFYACDKSIKDIFSSLSYTSNIGYFSREYENQMHSASKWKTEEIKKGRIRYFNSIGISLGDDYEAYENNEKAREAWPSIELVDKLENTRKKNYIESRKKYNKVAPEYQRIIELLKKYNFLDSTVSPKHITSQCTCVLPNAIKNVTYQLKPIVLINFDFFADYQDHHIVHELNHLYELHLRGIVGNYFDGICGWDEIGVEMTPDENDNADFEPEEEPREYELLNEVINELITQEICKEMHDDGNTIFDDPGNSAYKNRTGYDSNIFLVEEFFNRYKEVIKQSRCSGNIDIIFNAVGKNNFESLNRLITKYNDNFGGARRLSLLDDLRNNINNEATQLFFEIRNERDQILEQMDIVYQQYLESKKALQQ